MPPRPVAARPRAALRRWLAAGTLGLAVGCSAGAPQAEPTGSRQPSAATQPAPPSGRVTVVAAGDIACPSCADDATARLVGSLRPTVVLALGDLQYDSGTYAEFLRDYDRSWGRFRSITRPVPGNHEYDGGSAPGYYRYFGATAGHPRRGYYSFDAGGWHLVALNSNCGGAGVGGCGPDSPQDRWLAADLAAASARCTLAYWHHPRFSSGLHGSDRAYDGFWRRLSAAGAELVLGGHDHHYERFGPLNPDQRIDATRGVRQFVVGTGGRTRYPAFFAERGSERRLDDAYGVLQLTLRPGGYDWRFITVANKVLDSGTGICS